MTAPRRAIVSLLPAGLLALPACLGVPGASADRGQPAPPPAGRSPFAELRGPGQRLPMRDAPPTAVAAARPPAAEPPPAVAPAPPPTQFVATSRTVSPPAPAAVPPPPVAFPTAPPPPDPPLVAAVRAYLEDRPADAVDHLKRLDRPNQELMLQLIPALVRASRLDLPHASPTELGVLAGQLQQTADTLAVRAPLAMDRACFCRWVKNFGRYDPLPPDQPVRPGALTQLYVEVRNVPSEPARVGEADGFVTRLACTLEVIDAAGRPVPLADRDGRPVPALTETKRDFTRSPVRDYFLLFTFPVPPTPGDYKVAVKVLDPGSGREVSRRLPLPVR